MNITSYPVFLEINSVIAYEIHLLSLTDDNLFLASDFSFNSTYNWSLRGMENYITQIKDGYLFKMFDIVKDEYFYIPFTKNKKTFSAILNICYEDDLPVSLINENLLNYVDQSLYLIEENSPYNDYILKIDDYLNAYGNEYKWIRKKINNFKTNNLSEYMFVIGEFGSEDVKELTAFIQENIKPEEKLKEYELEALYKCIKNSAHFKHTLAKVYSKDGLLIAFNLMEYHNPKVLISNYSKCIKTYRAKGFNEYFQHFVCKAVKELGFEYINLEQDIGLPNLAAAKLSFQPHRIIKKYTLIKK